MHITCVLQLNKSINYSDLFLPSCVLCLRQVQLMSDDDGYFGIETEYLQIENYKIHAVIYLQHSDHFPALSMSAIFEVKS